MAIIENAKEGVSVNSRSTSRHWSCRAYFGFPTIRVLALATRTVLLKATTPFEIGEAWLDLVSLAFRYNTPTRTDMRINHAVRVTNASVQVAAEPYETIAFRIPAREIEDESDDAGYWNWSHWDPDTKQYSFQFMFRMNY